MRIISSQDLFESYMSDLDEAAVRVPRKVRGAKPSDADWQRGRSYAGKIISGDNNSGPKGYNSRLFHDDPVAPGQRPPSPQFGLSNQDRQSFRHHYEWSKKGYGKVGGAKGLPKPQAEEFELWVNSLVNEGYDLSEYTWDDVYEIYETYSDYLTVQAFLIGEGYADSIQESDYMIENMNEDLIDAILNEVTGDYHFRNWKPLSPRIRTRIENQANAAYNDVVNTSRRKLNSSEHRRSEMRHSNMKAALPGGGGAKPLSQLSAWKKYIRAKEEEKKSNG